MTEFGKLVYIDELVSKLIVWLLVLNIRKGA